MQWHVIFYEVSGSAGISIISFFNFRIEVWIYWASEKPALRDLAARAQYIYIYTVSGLDLPPNKDFSDKKFPTKNVIILGIIRSVRIPSCTNQDSMECLKGFCCRCVFGIWSDLDVIWYFVSRKKILCHDCSNPGRCVTWICLL